MQISFVEGLNAQNANEKETGEIELNESKG
jgi:hypothetical protein